MNITGVKGSTEAKKAIWKASAQWKIKYRTGETMQAAFHITTKVLPGNKIEIQLPEGAIGEEIEVIILLPEKPQVPKRSALEILADAHTLRSTRTPEEIDQYIQDEKNSWDS